MTKPAFWKQEEASHPAVLSLKVRRAEDVRLGGAPTGDDADDTTDEEAAGVQDDER